jgi:SAM-dependent methyltransferase
MKGSYAQAAEYYDLLYAEIKDYASEVERLGELIREACPDAHRILDVGCGSGRHAELLVQAGFAVDGLDLEPEFVRLAQARNPTGRFTVGDMTSFSVDEAYDAVLCLFGSIGYARDRQGLLTTVNRLAAATRPGGVVVVEPWLEPADMKDGYVTMSSGRAPDLVVCRVSRTTVRDDISRLEFEYLVARPTGIERLSETHELGLFARDLMTSAFRQAGLRVSRDEEGLMGRGLYVAIRS